MTIEFSDQAFALARVHMALRLVPEQVYQAGQCR